MTEGLTKEGIFLNSARAPAVQVTEETVLLDVVVFLAAGFDVVTFAAGVLLVALGIIRICPIFKMVLADKLLAFIILLADTPVIKAILLKVSPDLTVYFLIFADPFDAVFDAKNWVGFFWVISTTDCACAIGILCKFFGVPVDNAINKIGIIKK